MNIDRLRDHLDHMQDAAQKACAFLGQMREEEFYRDQRTQMAVGMALVLVAEAAARIARDAPEFLTEHPELPWSQIRGMRNLVVHDYYEVELSVVWTTVKTSLPELIADLNLLRKLHAQGE